MTAVFSDCGFYRYRLGRRWGEGPIMTFIMLNPSIANADRNDRTISRCIGFAQREGCGGIQVGNLFALVATNPRELRRHEAPIGPENDEHLLAILEEREGPIVAAWGANRAVGARGNRVAEMIGPDLLCLAHTLRGAPKHPLYIPGESPLRPFRRNVDIVV